MRPNVDSSSASDSLVPFVDLSPTLRRMGANPPSYASLKGHAYSGKFEYVRLPSGKLAVRSGDLPAIAAQYGAPAGDVGVAA